MLPSRKKELLQQARKLRGTYFPKYAFPEWVTERYMDGHFERYESDARACRIFFDEGDSPGHVLLLATQREPVNIGMRRAYGQERFEALFGWRTGAYGALAKGNWGIPAMPPNIAVICRTPIVAGLSGPADRVDENSARELRDPSKRAYVLNVIAYAFDSPQQPDQRYFLEGRRGWFSSGGRGLITDAKRLELIERFGRIFDKVFAASLHCHRKVIVLSKFGAGEFSANYPGSLFGEVWLPAFKAALEAWAGQLQKGGVVEVSLLGGEGSKAFADAVRQAGFGSERYTYFPEPLRRQLGDRLKEALLVNAWDSWSFIGNGNFKDHSLDGFMGRATAMAVLGWPVTNPWLKDNLVPVKRPSSEGGL